MTTVAHAQYLDQIPAYLAGGLGQEERNALEAHIAICAACRLALDEAAKTDHAMQELFASVRPGAGFEDKLIDELRIPPLRSRVFSMQPAAWRLLSGIAATLALAAVGYAMGGLIETNHLPFAAKMDASRSRIALATHPPRQLSPSTQPLTMFRHGSIQDRGEAQRITERLEQKHGGADPGSLSLYDGASSMGNRAIDQTVRYEAKVPELSYDGEAKTRANDSYALNLWSESVPQPDFDVKTGATVLSTSNGAAKAGDTTAPILTYGMSNGRGGPAQVAAGGFGGDGANVLGVKQAGSGLGFAAGPPPASSFNPVNAPPASATFYKPAEVAAKLEDLGNQRQGQSGGMAGKPMEPVALAKDQRTLTESTKELEKAAPKPDAVAQAGQTTQSPPPQQPPVPALQQRKIIRNGEMEFEVDSFDSTYMTISKIVTEEGGFVSSTNSEKLPNGKVRGTVVVRIPPDHLDTLVLKLRALGDLKSQKISAQDVTKVYYDLDSELKAAHAMEERLLNIIKSGKGEIKDLLEAEKQLGTYREKIEHLEGEIRYYNNLVSLSTLSITAFERDIRTPTSAAITEEVNMGVETEDVEKARTDALKAVETAKGRIIESNLKKFDAGQFGASIVAEVPPDASGPLIDRVRQLGRVARLDVERKQTTQGGTGTPTPGIRTEKKDTRFSISIYNLANVAPRQTTNLNVAVNNVEDAYRSIMEAVRGKNGRIVTSSLNRQKPEQTTASLNFEVPSADADATLAEIRRERDVMTMTVTENPDTNNVTSAKRGFAVQLFSLATVAPRQSEQALLAIRGSVPEAFRKLVDEARKDEARVLVSQLNEQDKSNSQATLEVEVPRTKELDFRQALGASGILFPGTITRSPDAENTVDSKVRISLRILSIDRLAPRETQTLGVATSDVPAAYQQLLSALQESGARIITSQLNEQNRSNITGNLDFEILAENRPAIQKALDTAGAVYSRSVTRSPDTVNTVEIKTRMQVTLVNEQNLTPRERTHYKIEVNNVDKATEDLTSAALKAGGKVIQADHSTDEGTDRVTGHVVVNVPLKNVESFRDAARAIGRVRDSVTNQVPEAPQGEFARAQVEIDLATTGSIVSEDNGLAASLRHAMATSVRGLLWSLELILIGLLIVGPWALILFGVWKVLRKNKTQAPATAA